MDRVIQCSSIDTCYNVDSNTYDKNRCRANESCASFANDEGVYVEGCILTKYCGITANYYKKKTSYTCPYTKDHKPIMIFNTKFITVKCLDGLVLNANGECKEC